MSWIQTCCGELAQIAHTKERKSRNRLACGWSIDHDDLHTASVVHLSVAECSLLVSHKLRMAVAEQTEKQLSM